MNFVYMIRDIKENLIVLEKYFVTWIFEISRYLSLLRSLCGIFGTKYRGTHSVAITGFFFHQQLHSRGIYRIYSHWISSNQLFSYSFSKNYKTLLSRNFCQKSVRVNFRNFPKILTTYLTKRITWIRLFFFSNEAIFVKTIVDESSYVDGQI